MLCSLPSICNMNRAGAAGTRPPFARICTGNFSEPASYCERNISRDSARRYRQSVAPRSRAPRELAAGAAAAGRRQGCFSFGLPDAAAKSRRRPGAGVPVARRVLPVAVPPFVTQTVASGGLGGQSRVPLCYAGCAPCARNALADSYSGHGDPSAQLGRVS